jgi:UDP-glucose 4-epimerase
VGITVREIMDSIEAVTGRPVPHSEVARRPGDPPALFASSEKIREDLGWKPAWTDINQIIETAAKWSKSPRY